jgi:3-hydroxyisobutyrate dehydrogenase
MARNLIKAGFTVTVWNRSRPGVDAIVAGGAAEAANPRDVAERSDVVITMVGDSPDVEQVALGTGGIIEGAHPGLVHIDMSTISPDVTRHIAERLSAASIEMLDAPVSGGEPGAINATLSIMAGGKEDVFERCLPVFRALGKKIVYCGPSGSGQIVKLCNQVVVGLNNLAVCEALVLCVKAGVDPRRMLDAIGAGAAASWAVANLAPKMLNRDLAGVQVNTSSRTPPRSGDGGRIKVQLPGTELVTQLFEGLDTSGMGAEGTQALIKSIENLAPPQAV